VTSHSSWYESEIKRRIDRLHELIDEAAYNNDSLSAMNIIYQIEALELMSDEVKFVLARCGDSSKLQNQKTRIETCAFARGLMVLKPLFLAIGITDDEMVGSISTIGLIDRHGNEFFRKLVSSAKPSSEHCQSDDFHRRGTNHKPFEWQEIWQETRQKVADRFLVIFNASSKLNLIRRACNKNHLPVGIRDVEVFCARELFTRYMGDKLKGDLPDSAMLMEVQKLIGELDYNKPNVIERADIVRRMVNFMVAEINTLIV